MLFILTGRIQIGKTRWLQARIAELEERDVGVYGVVAPGMWRHRSEDEVADAAKALTAGVGPYEKLGIYNELLPSHERIVFARRRDLDEAQGVHDTQSQSAKAGLGWAIRDEAIEKVNNHFAALAGEFAEGSHSSKGLVVVDELGRLELMRGEGLTQAMQLLEKGPQPGFAHALIIVREDLVPLTQGHFASWGESVCISPDDAGKQALYDAFA